MKTMRIPRCLPVIALCLLPLSRADVRACLCDLAIPRFHGNHPQQFIEMTPQQRTGYWSAAIAKARETWPNDPWGVALNSTERRTQCHIHLHIGKLLPNLADDHFAVVDQPADIPVPRDGDGVWIHPVDGRLHVHAEVPNGELNLER